MFLMNSIRNIAIIAQVDVTLRLTAASSLETQGF